MARVEVYEPTEEGADVLNRQKREKVEENNSQI